MRLALSALVLFVLAGACGAQRSSTPTTSDSKALQRSGEPYQVSLLDRPSTFHYIVRGNSQRMLRRSFRKYGPKRWAAYTSTHLRWRYRYQYASDGCRPGMLTVRLTGEIELPIWPGRYRADTTLSLAEEWDRYSVALEIHEEGHWWAGLYAREQIRRYLERLPGSSSCREVGRQADAIGYNILKSMRAYNRAYDFVTGHGRTQGARLSATSPTSPGTTQKRVRRPFPSAPVTWQIRQFRKRIEESTPTEALTICLVAERASHDEEITKRVIRECEARLSRYASIVRSTETGRICVPPDGYGASASHYQGKTYCLVWPREGAEEMLTPSAPDKSNSEAR